VIQSRLTVQCSLFIPPYWNSGSSAHAYYRKSTKSCWCRKSPATNFVYVRISFLGKSDPLHYDTTFR